MTHHARIRRLEVLLVSAWQQGGRRTWNDRGDLRGEHLIRYSADGDVADIETISLTALAEDIAREIEVLA